MPLSGITVQDLSQQALETIRKSQEAVVDAMRSWTDAVEQATPKLPTWPSSDDRPSPTQVVDSVFDFAGELLKLQRDYTHSLLAAATTSDRTATDGPTTA